MADVPFVARELDIAGLSPRESIFLLGPRQTELSTYLDYRESTPLAYWRSTSNFEVDFVLADKTAIEVKAKDPVGERDLRGLRALKEEGILKH